MRERIYLDHIAGTPLLPEVVSAMLPYLEGKCGNPQSLHSDGQEALQGIEDAREQVAGLVGAGAGEIIFTSSGSESNNLAVKGLALAQQARGKHIVLSAVEHLSVLQAAKGLEKLGFLTTLVPVDGCGRIDPEDVRRSIRKETVLVSMIAASSEVGTIEPIAEIARVAKAAGVLFHTDAVAAAGSVPINVKEWAVDALSLAANQFYGPKGAAALFLKKGTRILPLIDGGIQEGGRRAGTENVPGIVGMGKASEIALARLASRSERTALLRDTLLDGIPGAVGNVIVTGSREHRLPHHASFCVEFVEGEAMLLSLDMKGIAASSGSACTSKALKASHVLLAMGLDHAAAQGSLVFSLTERVKREDIDYLIEVFPPVVDRLRKMSPLYTKYLEEKGR